MARYAMTVQQKIQAAMKLNGLADENGHVDITLKDIAVLLEKDLDLGHIPSETGLVTIMEGAGLSWKKPAKNNNLPMVHVWNRIKEMQVDIENLQTLMSDQTDMIHKLTEEMRKLQLVNK